MKFSGFTVNERVVNIFVELGVKVSCIYVDFWLNL